MNFLSGIKNYRAILTLLTGTTLSQLFLTFMLPVLSRLYSFSDFAVYGFLQSIITPLSALACGRYEMTIVTARTNGRAVNAVFLSYLFSMVFALIVFVILLPFHGNINNWFQADLFRKIWFFLPLFIVAQGVYIANNFYLQRVKHFKGLAFSKIVQHGSNVVLAFFFYFIAVPAGLILGLFSGFVTASCITYLQMQKNNFSLRYFSLKQIKIHALEYKEYPLYNATPAFLYYLTFSIPVLLISRHFMSDIIGQYTLARQIMLIPSGMIASAISQVYFQRIVQVNTNNKFIWPEFKTVFIYLFLMALLMCLIVVPFGPHLFSFVFGQKWQPSGVFARYLIINASLQFICTSLINTLPALGKVKLLGLWQLGYFLLTLTLFLLPHNDIHTFLKYYLAIDSFALAINICMTIWVVKERDTRMSKTLINII